MDKTTLTQNAHEQVDLLKKYLINVVSKEEVVVEYWDNDKKDKKDKKNEKDEDKPSKTNNIISDNRIIQKKIKKQSLPCDMLVLEKNRRNFLEEERKLLSAKENGKTVKSIKNPPWAEEQNSFAELLIFFDKENEHCFNYNLIGVTKVKERDAIIMEVELEKSRMPFDLIMATRLNVRHRLPNLDDYALRIDRVLFDAETLEIIQYRKARMLPGKRWLPPAIEYKPYRDGYDEHTVEVRVHLEIDPRKIKFYQIDYGKIKIRDQFLTLPVEKSVSIFFEDVVKIYWSALLSNSDVLSRGNYIREKLSDMLTTPDLLSFARETHNYKYSDYKSFGADVKIKYGTAEEEP